MGVAAAPDIADHLTRAGLDQHVQIDIVAHAQKPEQIIASCKADSLLQTLRDHDVSNPAIFFVTWPSDQTQAMDRLPIQLADCLA